MDKDNKFFKFWLNFLFNIPNVKIIEFHGENEQAPAYIEFLAPDGKYIELIFRDKNLITVYVNGECMNN